MKAFTPFLTLFIFSSSFFSTKAQAFEQGKSYVSIGAGYSIVKPGFILNKFLKHVPFYNDKTIGPFTLKYEYGISEKIGIGFSVGYSNSNVNWEIDTTISEKKITNYYKYKVEKFTAKARFNYHFWVNHEKIDPYIGAGIGYRGINRDPESSDTTFDGFNIKTLIPIAFEASFGTRYIFSKHFGAFAEIGIGHGFIQAGLIGKF